ncbi:Prp18 domain containing protein [Nitzschia inconspicua]|uniref:Pre-mRNA-splicing factor 18 n=1 Tax=Nitzschia inconspicua TaxID=303405 RepID=A0A9K3LUI2_9STRA|nr:Prp18 domain containing protein [Nitzschia inconspicua]
MDLLQRELQRKKAALAKAKEEASLNLDGGGNNDAKDIKKRKYFKVSDLRRIEEEEEESQRLQRLTEQQQRRSMREGNNGDESLTTIAVSGSKKVKRKSKKDSSLKGSEKSGRDLSKNSCDESSKAAESATSCGEDKSPTTITRKLRQMGLVIRFFGETNEARWKRLQEALNQRTKALQGLSELEEFRLGKGHGIRNPFLERDKDTTISKKQKILLSDGPSSAAVTETTDDTAAAANCGSQTKEESKNDDVDDQSDPPKYIYKFLKGLLKEWEEDLADRPESVANSVAGKNESKTLKQCKDYIRPLFKLLKSRKLEDGLQHHLVKIVNFAKQGEFVKAHDAYMDVAIGRAAWPIGVTMVGIHARSGRAKIESANVAHVMNSELQRKYLTSVKRLLSYYQKKRTDVDPSKKVS